MANSYEVVLQQVASGDLFELLRAIEGSSKLLSDLALSEYIGAVSFENLNQGLIEAIVSSGREICLTGRLHEFSASPNICLPFVLLRVVKYREGVDVEFSFDDNPLFDIGCVMSSMRIYCNDLLKRFYASELYGGLEPAIDVETRYFTGTISGPLGL